MRAVVQRVSSATVTVGEREAGKIGRGLLVFVGVERGDGLPDVQYIAGKVRDLRVFEDPADPAKHVNRSVQDVGGSVLVVSQFTLTGELPQGAAPVVRRGRGAAGRPAARRRGHPRPEERRRGG